MEFKSDSRFSIENQPDIPDQDAFRVLKAVESERAKRVVALEKSVARMRDIQAKYRAALDSVMSREKQAGLRAFMAAEKKSFDEKMFTGAEKRLTNDGIERLLAERVAKTAQFMKRSGIDATVLGKVKKDFRKAFDRAFKPEVPVYEGRPARVMLPGEIPQAVREGKLNPWVEKVAPSSTWAWWYDGFTDGFSFDPTVYADSAAAFVGNISYLHDNDAGDFDTANVDFESRVGWWYKMPSAGILEVYVQMQPSECLHYLSLHDEFGISDSFSSQYDYATFRVRGGSYRTSSSSWNRWDGFRSGSWSFRHLTPGSSYWFHFFSAEAYAKDAWVLPEAGTMSRHRTFANDVSVYSKMDFRFFIQRMYVRVAP
ncbi:MAG: hypothetical protein QUS11_09105 [Candidatus Fermentibacter sp.]|nr:hypothetical protein [Candidatus Fermentibacter sp.]